MKIDDLKLSDSTLGVLKSRGYDLKTLTENREDLSSLAGIGPGREKEISRALDEAEKTGDASEATRIHEPEDAGETEGEQAVGVAGLHSLHEEEPEDEGAEEEEEEVPFEKPPESTKGVEVGGLVRYMSPAGKPEMARVAADLGDGKLNLQAFTGSGGAYRVESATLASEWGERGCWAPLEEA